MTEKIKTSKGETNVIREDATLLYKPNLIDVENAKITSGKKGEWDDFQVIGGSNTGERAYKNERKVEESQEETALRERLRDQLIGRKIKNLNLELA